MITAFDLVAMFIILRCILALTIKKYEVNFVTALGSDEVSDVARCLWQKQSLSLDYLQIAANKTLGSYGITTDAKGSVILVMDVMTALPSSIFI